jgi:TetR/AcrR family transcriptional repressor of nem operon
MRYGADHKQETRERVLREAAKAIRAEGPHQVAVAAVMARAGLTHGGFYAHFASKDDLVAAAIDQMFAEGLARLAQEAEGRTPPEALAAHIDSYLSCGHRDARATGCPLPTLAADLPRLPQLARERFAAGVAAVRQTLARELSAAGRPDAEAEASSVICEMSGALSLARVEPDPAASQAILERSKAALKRRLGLI